MQTIVALLEFMARNYTCQDINGQLFWRTNTGMAPDMMLKDTEQTIRDIVGRKLIPQELPTVRFDTKELSFIKSALNSFWWESQIELRKKDLGDIERKTHAYNKDESFRLMRKIEE